jgi:signal transduction histidine kinase
MTTTTATHLRTFGPLPGLRRVVSQPAVRRRQAAAAHIAAVSTLCHELKTPLGAMLLFAEMIGAAPTEGLGDEQRKRIQAIERAAQQMLGLIRSTLDDARQTQVGVRSPASAWKRPHLLS